MVFVSMMDCHLRLILRLLVNLKPKQQFYKYDHEPIVALGADSPVTDRASPHSVAQQHIEMMMKPLRS